MQYMFLVYTIETPEGLDPESSQRISGAHGKLMQETGQKGILLGAAPLKGTSTATTVRTEGSRVITTDGPFAETKEQFAGYYILECADLDEAIEWAAKIPTECGGGKGSIEIRPLVFPLPPPPGGDG